MSGLFQTIGRWLDELTGNKPPEPNEAERGAELVCELWCSQPEKWERVQSSISYRSEYKFQGLNLIVTVWMFGESHHAAFDGKVLELSKSQQARMSKARQAYNEGIKNARMAETARKLAEAILGTQPK